MTPEQIDLPRRLVACKGWRWMPGMLTLPFRESGPNSPVCHPAWRVIYEGGCGPFANPDNNDAPPDLTDPATAGCLLAVLVAAAPGSGWGVSCGPDVGWRATSCDHDLSGATCGEAVARALLVVWEAAS